MSGSRNNKGHYIPRVDTSASPKAVEVDTHDSALLRLKRWWKTLHWLWKVIIFPVLGTLWWVDHSFLPRIVIERETVQGSNSLLAEYKFTNTGILAAKNVEIFCGAGDEWVVVTGPSGAKFEFAKMSFLVAKVKELDTGQSATRGCRISFENNIPSGALNVWARYTPPWIPIPLRRSATFTFRYDSAAGGYVPVPDVTN
ncbi:hypothetical protein I5693_15730 [Burkholderia cenocepacia]|uniref:hypothetical protein n=1 Tax=Burkholderia cepacia complex TaxID=87882 RepID=UPI00158C5326|nr:hypothetical protein [Burkholderia cenocepacia]MBJ9668998.1 hypothetical protein [Burkholderia cenocepacia]